MAIAFLSIIGAGCGAGGDGPIDAAPNTTTTMSADPLPEPTAPESSVPSAADDADDSTPPDGLAAIAGLTAELIINRQRDLLDRGLINVQLVNDSGDDLVIGDRQLTATGFEIPAAPPRVSRVGAGRTVNLQVPYGMATECDVVDARIALEFDLDGGPRSAVEVGGVEILNAIRREQCAQVEFDRAVTTTPGEPKIDGDSMTVTLRFETAPGSPGIEVRRAGGTVLVGASIAEPVELQPGVTTELTTTFVVNRCDPHAMAEVTKRYGLELDVSIDREEPETIDVDIGGIASAFDTIVDACLSNADAP